MVTYYILTTNNIRYTPGLIKNTYVYFVFYYIFETYFKTVRGRVQKFPA
jgi:hypothetical protein